MSNCTPWYSSRLEAQCFEAMSSGRYRVCHKQRHDWRLVYLTVGHGYHNGVGTSRQEDDSHLVTKSNTKV